MAELGANPLVDLPIQYRWTPFFRYVGWHSHVDTYGPLWEMTSAATAIVVREALQALDWWKSLQANCPQTPEGCRTLVAYLSAYRLLAIALTGLSAALIVSLVRRNRPALTNMALAAWLWSPILLISTAVGAHNDALMLALLLFMLWLLQRRRWLLALLVVAMAAHVKLTVLPVLPVVGLWLVRQVGWRRALLLGVFAAAITVLVSWLLYAPFGGWDSLPRDGARAHSFPGQFPLAGAAHLSHCRTGLDARGRSSLHNPASQRSVRGIICAYGLMDAGFPPAPLEANARARLAR